MKSFSFAKHMPQPAGATHDQAEQPPARELGEFTVATKDSQFSYRLDAIGVIGNRGGVIGVLSTVASQTSIKALHACLSKAARTAFTVDEVEGWNRYWTLEPCSFGYRFYTAKLGYGTFHSLAIARWPGLMVKLSDASLWAELQSEHFTTPLLRQWLPYLRRELERLEYLKPMHCFQCEGAVLSIATDQLDDLVSTGLRNGDLEI